ncbi:MAG: hypothetical protein ACYDDS_19790 [Candidatus Sulfotelmatobacter sp.]
MIIQPAFPHPIPLNTIEPPETPEIPGSRLGRILLIEAIRQILVDARARCARAQQSTAPTLEIISEPVTPSQGPAFLWWKQCSGGVPVPVGDNGISQSSEEHVDIAEFVNDLAKKVGLEATWRDLQPPVVVNPIAAEYVPECVKRLKTEPRSISAAELHSIHDEERIRLERGCKRVVAGIRASESAVLRDWTIDARRSNDCRICDEPLSDELLMRGSYMCTKHSGTRYADRVIAAATFAVKNSEASASAQAKRKTDPWLTPWLKRLIEDDDAAAVDVEGMPFNKAVRLLQVNKRWHVEKRMVAKQHNRAPYEARSFSAILRESRTFPN